MHAPATQDARLPLAGWSAGIDWVTWMIDGKGHSSRAREIAHEIVGKHSTPLDRLRPFKLLRWEGWQTGAVRCGHHEASSMLQLSGAVAAESWIHLHGCGGRPSRLDVQTTLQLSTSLPSFGRRFLRRSSSQSRRSQSTTPRNGRWLDSRGSFLGTVGDRTKPRYLRVYDKGVEAKSANPGVLWRVEVEAKGRLAPKLWQSLTSAEDVEQWSLECCAGQWRSSGYCWPLSSLSEGLGAVSVPTAPPPDAERMAMWLTTSVRPAIHRMKAVYSREQLLELVGLETTMEVSGAA